MTDPKEKRKPVVHKREPKKRTDSGIFDNLRQIPQSHPVEEFLPPAKELLSTMGTQSTLSTQGQPTPENPISPTRDFMKVANSIHREAVPSGLFKGKCKQIYDFLYSKTRGAIVPSKSVRLTRREIMTGSDIGSTKTLFLNLRHLRDVGLVTWDERVGPHAGNVYTVHLPDETTQSTQSTQSTLSTQSDSSPKVLRVLRVESTQSTHSSSPIDSTTCENPKTFIKTDEKNDDDEALAGFTAAMKQAVKELTGRESTSAERQRWEELAHVLITELRIAAARTTVSNVPAFLAEHLRRRLFKKDKQQLAREEAESSISNAQNVDAAQCPDCYGTGMWYPQGYEKGVARCRHEKLSAAPTASEQPN
ncbi:MAG TPA: hypothetical protein VGV59_03250 [Pyrinomonadaceae bacterium]|nr:hypothetical protein [Pyrinomonadaceae bacterium]